MARTVTLGRGGVMGVGTEKHADWSTFGGLLRQLRRAAQHTQEELAEASGLSARVVSDLERGVIRRPRRDTVRMLTTALRLSPEAAATFAAAARGVEPPPPPPTTIRGISGARTAILGRDRELGTAAALLDDADARLLTVLGPGGVGKTRLAIEIALRSSPRFTDGVLFVDLTATRDHRRVVDAIARAADLVDAGDGSSLDRLATGLRGRQMLVVLDNVEQVARAAPDIARLGRRCPELRILSTSRVPLRVPGERTMVLEPLGLPPPRGRRDAAAVGGSAAVTLLVERARASRACFSVTEENAADVAEIVRRLDGLPLAIELVAPRLRLLSAASLLRRLSERLPLLTSAEREGPARQRSMREAISWSVDLLEPERRATLAGLSVFSGGWTYDAAEDVLSGSVPRPLVLDAMADLLDANLVRPLPASTDEPRLTMLETIREYAEQLLDDSGVGPSTRMRHAAWSLSHLSALEPGLWQGRAAALLPTFEAEHDNARTALRLLVGQGDGPRAVPLTSALSRYWQVAGYSREALEWYDRVLGLEAPEAAAERANVLMGKGASHFHLNQPEASTLATQSAIVHYQAVGDRFGEARGWCNLGVAADGAGDLRIAAGHYARSLALFRTLGEKPYVAGLLTNLAVATLLLGDHATATELNLEALGILRCRDAHESEADILSNLGCCALAGGDLADARRWQLAALDIRMDLGRELAVERCVRELGFVAAAEGFGERAARLLGVAERLREEHDGPIIASDAGVHDRWVGHARSILGAVPFARAWSAGRAMGMAEAVSFAREPYEPATTAASNALP